MVQIDGTYQFVENVGAEALMQAVGKTLDEKVVALLKDTNLKLTVKLDGDKCTMTSPLGTVTFTFGEEFEDVTPFGYKLKTVASKDGDKIVKESEIAKRVYEFADSGLTCTFTLANSSITAVRVYKRV